MRRCDNSPLDYSLESPTAKTMKVYIPIALVLSVALIDVIHATLILTTGTAAVAGLTISTTAASVAALVLAAAAGTAIVKAKGKREATSCLPFKNPELFFTMAANNDFLSCGRRFVCELEATDDANLAEEEKLIRDLFSRGTTAINGTAGGYFAEAGLLGANDGVEACAAVFEECPHTRKDIFLAFKEAQKA